MQFPVIDKPEKTGYDWKHKEHMFFHGAPRSPCSDHQKAKDNREDDDLSITELAEDYRRSGDLLEARLASLREEMQTARGEHYFDLQRRVDLLRYELVDTRQLERMLRDYYC